MSLGFSSTHGFEFSHSLCPYLHSSPTSFRVAHAASSKRVSFPFQTFTKTHVRSELELRAFQRKVCGQPSSSIDRSSKTFSSVTFFAGAYSPILRQRDGLTSPSRPVERGRQLQPGSLDQGSFPPPHLHLLMPPVQQRQHAKAAKLR